MPVAVPFLPSETNYVLACPIDEIQVNFDVRWNSRDQAWYFDMYEADDTPILLNVKVVLGVCLSRRSQHPFFESRSMIAVDTTNTGTMPGFDDLGGRVQVLIQSIADFV